MYLLPLLVALLALAGCGNQTSDTGSGEAGETAGRAATEQPLEATDDPASRGTGAGGATVQPVTETPVDVEEALAPQGTVVTVERVIEGDTFEISPAVRGKREVRLIGVDAPEAGNGGDGQPFGDAAAAQANSLIGGRKVALGFDEKKTDRSGRLLVYMRLPGGDLFNESIVRAGYALAAVSPPNVRYEEEILAAQRAARESRTGIWSLPPAQLCQLTGERECENVRDDRPAEPAPQDAPPVAGLPPVPPDGDYDCGHFNNPQQAQRLLESDPSDPHGLDPDQNGVACD